MDDLGGLSCASAKLYTDSASHKLGNDRRLNCSTLCCVRTNKSSSVNCKADGRREERRYQRGDRKIENSEIVPSSAKKQGFRAGWGASFELRRKTSSPMPGLRSSGPSRTLPP